MVLYGMEDACTCSLVNARLDDNRFPVTFEVGTWFIDPCSIAQKRIDNHLRRRQKPKLLQPLGHLSGTTTGINNQICLKLLSGVFWWCLRIPLSYFDSSYRLLFVSVKRPTTSYPSSIRICED